MELEKQVCSLELSRKLKDLGVPQNSYFRWYFPETPKVEVRLRTPDIACAFNVAELGDLLPQKVGDAYNEIITTHQGSGNWLCTVVNVVSGHYTDARFEDYTEADARARMLIYLLENDLLNLVD